MTQSFADGALLLDLHDDHAVLTLSQPGKKNALSRIMWRALPDAIAAVAVAPAKVLIVTGAGEAFSAGADISEFETVWATPESAKAYATEIAAGVSALDDLAKPTLAAIQGPCVGGGMGLALACDLRIAAEGSRFGITPGKLGLIYSLEDTKRLMDVVGPAAAKDILFTGRLLDCDEALSLGLINVSAPPHEFPQAVQAKAAQIASASQWSARGAKAMVKLILSGQVHDDDTTKAWFQQATQEADFQEGRAAFLEKRKPQFPFR